MATMTQTRTFAKHGLRKTVSSPAAAAAVQELVSNMSKLDVARQSPLHERSASPRLCYTREPGSLSAPYESPHRMSSSDDHEKQASTASTVRQHDAALSRATGLSHAHTAAEAPLSASAKAGGAVVGEHALLFFQKQRTSVPDSPVYTAFRRELTNLKLNGQDAASSDTSTSASEFNSQQYLSTPISLQQQQQTSALEASLEEGKTANRLLSRALAAVQQRLKQVESEKEQLRRERDYFRNMALRFPFLLSPSPSANPNASFDLLHHASL